VTVAQIGPRNDPKSDAWWVQPRTLPDRGVSCVSIGALPLESSRVHTMQDGLLIREGVPTRSHSHHAQNLPYHLFTAKATEPGLSGWTP
jgi:hypothetical protein